MKKLILILCLIGVVFGQEVIIKGRNSNGTPKYIRVDDATNAPYFIDFAHHEIHEGDHYFLQSFDLLTSSGDSLIFCIDVPDTVKKAHLIVNFGSQATAEYYTYVDAVCTGVDTISVVNNDLNSTNQSMLTFMKNPTITDIGTLVEKHSTGSGTNAGTGRVGVGGREAEIILKSGSKHIFLFITRANSNVIDYEFSWYEHTPGN